MWVFLFFCMLCVHEHEFTIHDSTVSPPEFGTNLLPPTTTLTKLYSKSTSPYFYSVRWRKHSKFRRPFYPHTQTIRHTSSKNTTNCLCVLILFSKKYERRCSLTKKKKPHESIPPYTRFPLTHEKTIWRTLCWIEEESRVIHGTHRVKRVFFLSPPQALKAFF